MTDTFEAGHASVGRNSAATIERILASAEAEFGSKGLDGAKIDDIAKAAGISKQLIYHYFKGKVDLYSELLLHLARRNMELLCAIDFAALTPLDGARAFFETLFRTFRDNPFSSTITLDQGLHVGAQVRYHHQVEKLREDLYLRFGASIERGKADGQIRQDVDVAAVHFLAVVMVTGSLTLQPMFLRYTRRGIGKEQLGPDATAGQFTEYFMRAISA